MHEDPLFDALEKLDTVKPNSAEMPSPHAQLARFKANQPSPQGQPAPYWRTQPMNNTRKFAIVGILAALLVGLFVSPAARTFASDFLGIFEQRRARF